MNHFYKIYTNANASNDASCAGLDVNDTEASTNWIKVESCEEVMIYIEPKTGTSNTFETCVEISPNGVFNGGCYTEKVGGVDVEEKLQGSGYMHIYDTKAIEFLRVSCATPEGSAATADVYIQGFRKA